MIIINFYLWSVTVVIDAYPNTPQVSQGTTVVLVCHVAGVPSDTMVTYQWSCPSYRCNASGLQIDGNITSRRQEGNIVVVDVVNTTDSGTYTCTVRSSESTVGIGTYTIDSVKGELFTNEVFHCIGYIIRLYACMHV